MRRRVVVTGTGVISPLGNDVETLWDNIKNGRSGIKRLESEEYKNSQTQIAGFIDDFNVQKYLDKKDANRFDLFTQFAYAAAMQALEQAEIPFEGVNKERIGIYIGSGIGGLHTLLNNYDKMKERGPGRVSPFVIPMMISNIAAGIIAIKTGFCGPSYSPVSACATGNQAIGEAYLNIAHGYSDAILAGGSEAVITPFIFAGFNQMNAMSIQNDTPAKACKPFDVNRDGFVMSEGAGILFLEEYEFARKRGAKILGEIIGYGSSTDAYHITSPDFNGAALAMQRAIEMADIKLEDIGYINAHGTGTPVGDISETKAIKKIFGDQAANVKVSSTKSMTGHLFGAAGAVEAIITLKAIEENIAPPTINYENPDPECDLNYVPNHAIETKINIALSDGFGFGGHNSVLAFKK